MSKSTRVTDLSALSTEQGNQNKQGIHIASFRGDLYTSTQQAEKAENLLRKKKNKILTVHGMEVEYLDPANLVPLDAALLDLAQSIQPSRSLA